MDNATAVRWLRAQPAGTRRGISTYGPALAAGIGFLPTPGWGWVVVKILVVVALVAAIGLTNRADTGIADDALVTARQERDEARQSSTDAREDAQLAMSDSVQPLIELLASEAHASTKSDRVVLADKMITGCVHALSRMVGADRSRACFFEYVEDDQGAELHPRAGGYAGRGQAPTTVFRSGTPAGDKALAMVRTNGDLFVFDVDESPPTGWSGPRGYRTFASVAVTMNDRPYGMLTIDALAPGDLTETTDVPVVRIMATLLVIALAR